jgi:hypothetical protein
MKTLSIKEKMSGLLGALFLALFIFTSLVYFSLPATKSSTLPKPNTLYKLQPETLELTASPFGSLWQGGVVGAVPGMNGITQNPPTAPSLPSLPRQPGITGGPGFAPQQALVVLGVLPPKVAIIQDGGKTLTVKVGEETSFGVVEAVTAAGVTIGQQFYALKSGGQ